MVQQVSIRNEDTSKTTKTFLFPPSCFTDIVVVPHLVIATRDHLCNLWIKALNGLRTVTESVWEGFFVVAYNHIMYLFFYIYDYASHNTCQWKKDFCTWHNSKRLFLSSPHVTWRPPQTNVVMSCFNSREIIGEQRLLYHRTQSSGEKQTPTHAHKHT